MHARLPLVLGFVIGSLVWPQAQIPAADGPPPTRQVTLNGQTFTLPADFTIEVVAGPELTPRPIAIDMDYRGRLFVADSSGSNAPVATQLEQRPHRLLRLDPADSRGIFPNATVFADKLMFPEGMLCYRDAVYTAAPPSIWRFVDRDDDGHADERAEWFQGKTLNGCANDLHGPYLGPDGWIYWCKGAFERQEYPRPGRKPLITKAAHVFRARPDGTGIEAVMTGGMDNPIKVAFHSSGERFISTTFLQNPAGGKRDGLIHALYGGVYGKDYFVAYDHPWTSPQLLPPLTHMGPAAPCGMTMYASTFLGDEYRDNLFVAQFNLRKVSRHELIPDGASFQTRDTDFLVSDNFDFHPTDVFEDADGSLLIVDTGGWYKICCPTSQLHKPDILGAIYRVRRQGMPAVADPRGERLNFPQLNAEQLLDLLGDPRPVVRRRAIEEIDRRQGPLRTLERAMRSANSATRQQGLWAASHVQGPVVDRLIQAQLTDSDPAVRQVALHVVSVRQDQTALDAVLPLLRSESLPNRRAAAEALGRIGSGKAATVVEALFRAIEQTRDRSCQHSLTYALLELGDVAALRAGLAPQRHPLVRRAALTALDQLDDGDLTAAAVVRELSDASTELRDTAWWIIGKHPDWGGALANYFREQLQHPNSVAGGADEFVRRLARAAGNPAIQALLAEQLARDPADPAALQITLRAAATAGLKEPPETWFAPLPRLIGSPSAEAALAAIQLLKAYPAQPLTEAIQQVLRTVREDEQRSVELRLQAASASRGVKIVPSDLFQFWLTQLDAEQPVQQRGLAADAIAQASLSQEQLLLLTTALEHTTPLELDRLLEAFAKSTDDRVGLTLVESLTQVVSKLALRVDVLRPRLANFGPAVQPQVTALYARIDQDAVERAAQLERVLSRLADGDIRRGQAIFRGTKTACTACHAIGYVGGNIGPDLTRVGAVRQERDLLESILFPSASIVRSYETTLIALEDGRTVNGIIRKETSDELVVAISSGQETRVPRRDIAEMKPSTVSIMPTGLATQLTEQDLADLLAFLKNCR